MIQQPELGKKIADCRKRKGLTQEELVEKCNLSVRTLQRIEAGEVTPRIHTVKLISEALELDFEKSLNLSNRINKRIIQIWLEQFYISFINLFNLKTNTMKKITILSIMTTVILIGTSSLFNKSNAQDSIKSENHLNKKTAINDTIKNKKIEIGGIYQGWNTDKELIGRDVRCIINGVLIKSPLLRLDKAKNEVRTPCITGILLEESVLKITNMKCQPKERIVEHIIIEGDYFIYKRAELIFENESIKAAKIIVPRD